MPDNENHERKYSIGKMIAMGAGAVAIIGGLFGAVQGAFALDERYLKPATAPIHLDNHYLKISDYQQMRINEQMRDLENKIFEIRFKVSQGTATALEKAMLERYLDQLETLRRQID